MKYSGEPTEPSSCVEPLFLDSSGLLIGLFPFRRARRKYQAEFPRPRGIQGINGQQVSINSDKGTTGRSHSQRVASNKVDV